MAPPSFDIYSDFDKNFRKQLYNQTKNLFTSTLKDSGTTDDFNSKLTILNDKLQRTTFANKAPLDTSVCQFTNSGLNYSDKDASDCYNNYINKIIDKQVSNDLTPFYDRLNTLKINIQDKFNDYELLYKLTNNNTTLFDSLQTLYQNMETELEEKKNSINKDRHNIDIINNNIKNSKLTNINRIMYIINSILILFVILLGVYLAFKNKDTIKSYFNRE